MAKAYGSIAKYENKTALYDSMVKHVKESHCATGKAVSDTQLRPKFYDFVVIQRKSRAVPLPTEESRNAMSKKSSLQVQQAVKTIPEPLYCLPLELTTDYSLQDHGSKELSFAERLELHVKDPVKHVFHMVTDGLNFASTKMWFLISPPAGAPIQVENIDDSTWPNSSCCLILHQLESADSAQIRMSHFKAEYPPLLSVRSACLRDGNPKYLSMPNHLRFYIPEVYPKLDGILFFYDDSLGLEVLTPLWPIDLEGMVKVALKTCKESLHWFDKHPNFPEPKISQIFVLNACRSTFEANIFDLKQWKKQNITGICHHWQDLSEDQSLWKLGSLTPEMITFYNPTYPLDFSWYVMGLGYEPELNQTEIEDAAVIHYNGCYKLWLDLAIMKDRSAFERVRVMGHVLSLPKDKFCDSFVVQRKLKAMLLPTEERQNAIWTKNSLLIQQAVETIPEPLYCLPLELTTDNFLWVHGSKEVSYAERLELHAKDPVKRAFHEVTDRLNFAAMKMWFLINPPAGAAIQVENIDDFKWPNSCCSVMYQLESTQIREFYFKAKYPTLLSVCSASLKDTNPKYLSMLNQLEFYHPEVYPKLDRILFLYDDIVGLKVLTPLWPIDLQGMMKVSHETCKESFHWFDKYLNFPEPKISQNFVSNACGWTLSVNIFDLKQWKKRDITGICHHWQDLNEDQSLWKLGLLTPELITFYESYPLDLSWHVLGLGYDPELNQTEIEDASVIHYNANCKP